MEFFYDLPIGKIIIREVLQRLLLQKFGNYFFVNVCQVLKIEFDWKSFMLGF
jgi:hypothetical protein